MIMFDIDLLCLEILPTLYVTIRMNKNSKFTESHLQDRRD